MAPKIIPPHILLYLSADVQGNLEPCGCKSGQIGGLPRQARFILDHHKQAGLLVDAGNSMSKTISAYEIFKWYYVLLIYERIGYDAVNLGRNEIALPAQQISTISQAVTVPLISCNVSDSASGALLGKPYLLKTVAGVITAIIGVTQAGKTGENVKIAPPLPSLKEYLPQLLSQSHVIVVLADVALKTAEEIARQFPAIDMILLTGEGTFSPKKVGPVVISGLTSQGRYLQQLRFAYHPPQGLKWVTARDIRLGEKISDHPGTVYLLNRYREELAHKRFYLLNKTSGGERYAGASRCARCHLPIYRHWKSTAHAHSFETLQRKGNHHDPACLRCHVTGFRSQYGYLGEKRTPDLAGVGCEVCHGPSARHANHDNPNQLPPSPANPSPQRICLECHTWEHCGHFDFPTFWAKIAHPKTEQKGGR